MWAGWPEFGQYRNLQQDLDRSWNWVLGFWRCPQTRKLQNLCWHVCHQKHHTCSLCSHNVSDHVYVHATHKRTTFHAHLLQGDVAFASRTLWVRWTFAWNGISVLLPCRSGQCFYRVDCPLFSPGEVSDRIFVGCIGWMALVISSPVTDALSC